LLATGMSVRETATEIARLTGLPRRQAYRLALEVSAGDTTQRATDSDDDT
jgi:hypothetical protein